MSEALVNITVKLFAVYQEAYGILELKLSFAERTPVQAVLDYILREHPELESWRNLTRFGVNLQFVEPNILLHDGDEVVLIPPVSGG
jgi:molybdopterin synthase sulfur carrier subunit